MTNESVVLLGCGDNGPVHEPMEAYSTLARPVFAAGDIRFGQCERVYSDHKILNQSGVPPLKPHMISLFTDCNFNVVSLASNHTMDWGVDTLVDSIGLFNQKGIQTIGAGRNLREARKPAFIEKNGVKIAFLGYCSVPPEGHEAGPNKGGVAPLRAHTTYEPYEYQAGVPPRIVTVPYEEDLKGMIEDITEAKKAAHVVVISLHWGIHFIPKMIAEYQPIVAEAAFKAGADLILGHHSHCPKGIGVHGGKVCFYSLGNFMFSTLTGNKAGFAEKMKRYGIVPDGDDYPLCPMGSGSKRSLIAKAVLTRDGVKRVSFFPVLIDKQLRPEPLRQGDPRFDEVVGFMDWLSEDLDHAFRVEGNEVVLKG